MSGCVKIGILYGRKLLLGKIKYFSLRGLTAFFRSHDHRPPHFHVKKTGKWEIRVFILTSDENNLHYDFKFPKNKRVDLSSDERKEITRFIEENKEDLLKCWETKVVVKENYEL